MVFIFFLNPIDNNLGIDPSCAAPTAKINFFSNLMVPNCHILELNCNENVLTLFTNSFESLAVPPPRGDDPP